MTIEGLKDIPFHFVAHMALELEHTMSHETEDGRRRYDWRGAGGIRTMDFMD